MVRAACYGASDLQVAAFERLREISFAFRICGTVRIRRSPVGADAHIGPLGSCDFAEDFRKTDIFCFFCQRFLLEKQKKMLNSSR